MSSALENECVNKSPCRHALHAIQPARVRRALRRLAAFKCQVRPPTIYRRLFITRFCLAMSGTNASKKKRNSSEAKGRQF